MRAKPRHDNDVPSRLRWLNLLLCGTVTCSLVVIAVGHWADASATRRARAKIEALRAVGRPVTLDDFDLTPPPDRQNARIAFNDVLDMLAGTSLDEYLQSGCQERLPSDHERVVELAQRFFDAAHAASRLQRGDWFQQEWTSGRSDLGSANRTAAAIGFRARSLALRGDDVAALDEVEAVYRIGAIIWQPPLHIIGFNVGNREIRLGVQGVCRTELADRIASGRSSLAAERIRALIDRLVDETETRAAWRRAVEGEGALILFDMKGYLSPSTIAPGRTIPSLNRLRWIASQPEILELLQSLRDLADASAMPASDNHADAPPGAARRLRRAPIEAVEMILWNRDFLFDRLMSDRLTACVLAAALYVREQGAAPVTIDDLVPDYLPAVPVDCFDPSAGPVHMRIQDMELQFYSVRSLVTRKYGEMDRSREWSVFSRLRLVPPREDE